MNPKKPKSVWIATILAGLTFVQGALWFSYIFIRAESGIGKSYVEGLKDPVFFARLLLCLICFPALLLKPKAKGTYYLTAAYLGILAVLFVQGAMAHRNIPPFGDTLPARIIGWSLAALMALLFCRFTFGRPSREYFGNWNAIQQLRTK